MAFSIKRKKKVNVIRVGIKIGMTVLALYVSGYFLSEIGNVMLNTSSAFYKGLTLIGWTITDNYNGTNSNCGITPALGNAGTIDNCITATSGAGILAIVGIIAVATLIFEFVDFSY